MMDQEGDIASTKAKMPVQPIPDITREVLGSHREREGGFRTKKTFTVSPVLRACAEDELVKKEYKEMRCDIPGLTKSTFLMVFSPDGTKMASTHGNHNVYVTDLRTGKNIKTLVGHPRTPWCVAFHPSSNQILASGCLGGQVRIWDLSGGSEVWTAESQTVISSLAFHPVDRLLVIATYNELYFWDWSQPKPFMQTCTNNAKEKVRYVAFDRLGHKLITGIANTPQGFTRWERVRAPVPVTRHTERIAAYRRRITPRLAHPTSQFLNSTPPENTNNQNSIPERERRIAVCYRNLVEQYEMLVHRYLEVYRPATTIDRGTDPMEAEHLNSTESQTTTVTASETANTETAPTIATASTSQTTEPSTSGTNAASTSRTSRESPPVVPGPSGLSRPSVSRPNKRSNVPGTKSDSSTVYQSDSSSSSSSDESPTPKRRISLVPNSSMFRNKTEPGSNLNKNVKDSSTCTRKKLFISRPSAFHLTRASNSQSSSSVPSRNRPPFDRDRFTSILSEIRSWERDRERDENPLNTSNRDNNRSSFEIDRFTTILSELRSRERERDEGPSTASNRDNNRPTFERDRFTSTISRDRTSDNNDNEDPSNTTSRDINSLGSLPFTLDRLRGISEGSLSSADEVINFSERPIGNREEPEAEPTENFTPDLPGEPEFPQQPGGIESIYSHILNDLETNLREARNSSRPEPNRNTDPSNLLASFSERLENIMNQSDAILANLRRSMEMLMEPSSQQTQNSNSPSQQTNNNEVDVPPEDGPSTSQAGPSSSGDNAASRRIFILRKPSGFHSHHRQCLPRCSGTSRPGSHAHGPSNSHTYPSTFAIRGSRYFRIRQSRFNVRPHSSSSSVWRPFDDHSYPRDPETNSSESNQRSNVEPIRSLLTLSPRSPSAGVEGDDPNAEPNNQPERSSTPALFPTAEHNYPLPDPLPSTSEPVDVNSTNENPIADHTYPRDPQNSVNNSHSPDYIAPLVSSLHSTISHISMQTNLLRRQVESIEMIDRARFEVFQLQELRRMWEEIRRHVNFVNFSTSERRSNLSNVRQMMAWTRISDPSPSSESAQSSTEQSTPEPSPSTPDRPTPSTSRSSASSSNESRPQSSQFMSRFRQCHIKKRMYWRRRLMKHDNPHLIPRRYLRGHNYRELSSRSARSDFPGRADNLTEVTVSLMVRGLEHLLNQQSLLLGRRDYQNSPDRNSMEYRLQSERVIQSRLRAARMRLNRVNQSINGGGLNYLEDPVEYSSLGSRNDWIRYETRLRLSGYIETLTRFIENHSSIPPHLSEQIKVMLELALLLTDLLLLQIMESIPSLSGSILDPERESLSRRITQMCINILQNHSRVRSSPLLRILHELRYNTLIGGSDPGRNPPRRNNHTNDRPSDNPLPSSNNRPLTREPMLDLNRQLRRLYQYLNDPEPYTAPPPPAVGEPSPGTSTENSSMSHVHRLGDLLVRLRNIRGRLEQVSQSAGVGRIPGNSSSTTEHEPARSTDESPSDRESEPFEGFQSQWDQPLHDSTGSLYRTQHINLYPPDPPSSSQSSPERLVQNISTGNRSWNVPTVQVNDVPIAEVLPNQPRIWLHRYPSDLRPLSAATGLFRPRFLIPLYAGVNPFDADLDDPQREGPVGYDGIMTTTVSPNHRIQMWDISKCNIPNISNHEKNVVVAECKIHNDGSVDISNDGTLLVTLLPSGGYLNVTNRLGIYSIKWDTLGQCLYTTSFEQNAISVSLSPLSRHLIVGLASRRVTLLPSDRWTMARIFLLDDRNTKIMGRGRLILLRDLEQGRERDLNFMSVNCIKWMPVSGQGIVYATNTGQLKVLT